MCRIDPCPGRTIERLEQENARLLTELQTVCCRKNAEIGSLQDEVRRLQQELAIRKRARRAYRSLQRAYEMLLVEVRSKDREIKGGNDGTDDDKCFRVVSRGPGTAEMP